MSRPPQAGCSASVYSLKGAVPLPSAAAVPHQVSGSNFGASAIEVGKDRIEL